MELTAPLILALLLSGVGAGLLGALVGVGGGLIVVPSLVLLFDVDIKTAVACSLVAVVASSTTAGSVYVGKGLSNMRLGMLLEVATTLGGITGGLIAVYISPLWLESLFAVLMIVTAFLTFRAKDKTLKMKPETENSVQGEVIEGQEDVGRLGGVYFDSSLKAAVHYRVSRVPFGGFVSFIAGILSGLLGVGGGFMKVPAMNLGMGVPMKVATATSNLMIGVTAVSSLFVYFARGFVHPLIAAPVAIGVFGGALYGTSLSQKISPKILRRIFAVLLILVALQMAFEAFGRIYG